MRIRRFSIVPILALILASSSAAHADTIVINNGLAPPNPANVIDDGAHDSVYVRNVGCPPGWPSGNPGDPCPSPGAPTEVAIVDGAEVWDDLWAYESSTITMSGGLVGDWLAHGSSANTMSGGSADFLFAYDSSTMTITGDSEFGSLTAYDFSTNTMSGGSADFLFTYDSSTITMSGGQAVDLTAYDSSSITMTGGVVGGLAAVNSATIIMSGGSAGDLEPLDSSRITIVGTDFAVDGSPVPYGDLAALTGTLTGTLASGESLNCTFDQGGGGWTGTITLVPEPSTALLLAFGLVALAAGRRRRSA